MVTANVNRLANQAQDTLEGRDIRGLATVAAASAGGVIVAQAVADRVMGFLDMPADPTTVTEFGASIAIKTVVAVALGIGAAQASGLVLIALAFAGLGALASAGVDLIDGLLRTAPLGGSSPMQSGSVNRQANKATAQQSRSLSSRSRSAGRSGGVLASG